MLRLLIDENFNHRILRGVKLLLPNLEYVVVQNTALQGVEDSPLLEWAAEQNRTLVTHDLKTIPKHAYARAQSGQLMTGVIAIPKSLHIGQAIEELAIAVECCDQSELANRVMYLPV